MKPSAVDRVKAYLLTSHPQSRSAREIAEGTGLSRSSVFRALTILRYDGKVSTSGWAASPLYYASGKWEL
jgi:DNA-binding MarR family transcriptional regulator